MAKRGRQDEPDLDATVPSVGLPKTSGLDAEFGPGDAVGDFDVEELRARGGFGTVYRARRRSTGALVALKVLHQFLAASDEIVKRFEREALSVGRLDHPNIVTVHEFGTLDDGRPYYTMEWMPGRTLHEELSQRGPFSLEEAVAVMRDLCAALSASHELGIVHRDVKASNVMVVPANEWFVIKLFDFGLAKLLEPQNPEDISLTTTGARMGTPNTMAPEQILGRPVDERTDIYALGVVMHQLLTGRFPFDAPTAIEIEELHLQAPPPRASDLVPIPQEVDAVLATCLAKRPEDRYQRVDDVIDALREATGAASGPSWADQLRPSVRFRATSAPCLAVHVDARAAADADGADDAVFDALDDALAAALEILEAADMEVGLEGGTSFLTVAVLPDDPEGSAARRRQLIDAARAVGRATADAAEIRVAVTVHTGSAILIPDGRQYVGGELLHLSDWTAGHPGHGVAASPAALEGLHDVAAEPIPGTDALVTVRI